MERKGKALAKERDSSFLGGWKEQQRGPGTGEAKVPLREKLKITSRVRKMRNFRNLFRNVKGGVPQQVTSRRDRLKEKNTIVREGEKMKYESARKKVN